MANLTGSSDRGEHIELQTEVPMPEMVEFYPAPLQSQPLIVVAPNGVVLGHLLPCPTCGARAHTFVSADQQPPSPPPGCWEPCSPELLDRYQGWFPNFCVTVPRRAGKQWDVYGDRVGHEHWIDETDMTGIRQPEGIAQECEHAMCTRSVTGASDYCCPEHEVAESVNRTINNLIEQVQQIYPESVSPRQYRESEMNLELGRRQAVERVVRVLIGGFL